MEHKFQQFLRERYTVEIGSSAKGIDLPGFGIETDIKVTSITQPQSSCPFKNARQKIFGLGYNLLVFVYDKQDTKDSCILRFTHCTFIGKQRTADFTITKRLREMVYDGANKEDIILNFRSQDNSSYNMCQGMRLFIMSLPMKSLIIRQNKDI